MGNILIVTEIQNGSIREASFELVTVARNIAKETSREVTSLVIGSGVGDLANDFASKGGGETLVSEDNMLLRGCQLRNADWAVGLVLATG